jgi:hypothetical protein
VSLRVEWFDAAATSVEVVPKGIGVGEHHVTAEFGIIIGADECCVIEGDYDRLHTLLRSALAQLEARKV